MKEKVSNFAESQVTWELWETRRLMRLQCEHPQNSKNSFLFTTKISIPLFKMPSTVNAMSNGGELIEKCLISKSRLITGKLREKLTGKEEVIINRLRTEHCRLTHGYLMNRDTLEAPPVCEWCHNEFLNVKHLLLECSQLDRFKDGLQSFRGVVNLKFLLGERANLRDRINFLINASNVNKI